MILAAGLGTRLRPITDRIPKALVQVGGVPMLERVARVLISAGVERLIVNVHHHADRIEAFLEEKNHFGIEVRVSREPERPLETGGGLRAAAPLFAGRGPFFLHNVDVLCGADLGAMYEAHLREAPLATLAVQERPTSRPLLVDEEGLLGLADLRTGWRQTARPPKGRVREIGFAGIHVVSPGIFEEIREVGRFSIWDPYLRLVAEGRRIRVWDIGESLWLEVGDPERLERANRVLAGGND